MSNGQSRLARGSAAAALVSSLVLLVLFSVLFGLFLILPFFVFIGGLIAMFISDRRRGEGGGSQ